MYYFLIFQLYTDTNRNLLKFYRIINYKLYVYLNYIKINLKKIIKEEKFMIIHAFVFINSIIERNILRGCKNIGVRV